MYKRVLLKLSGEALMGSLGTGVDQEALLKVCSSIKELYDNKIEIGIVIGGGNIFRGIQQGGALGIERTPADQMGMLATLINGIALKQGLLHVKCPTEILTALPCPAIAESYRWERAMDFLSQGKIVIFVGGTGHPYFTTDTTAALRASEIKSHIFLKATTRVDGIYDRDPRVDKNAKKFETLTYQEIIERRLGILDLTAVTLCMTNKIPIRVFNFFQGSLLDALSNRPIGTLVTGG